MRFKYIIIIILFLLSSLLYSQSKQYIDVINLKNGDIIKGRIIENIINKHIRVELQGGSILTYNYDQITSIEVEEKSTRTFDTGNQTHQAMILQNTVKECYNDGYASGQSVSTAGAMLGGFAGGFGLGLIGWGISYVVVAGGNPHPPYIEISSLEQSCIGDYTRGYREGALKTKKASVNAGGIFGTIAIVVIALSVTGY